MKICNKCGKENSNDAKFCIHCGSEFEEKPQPQMIRIEPEKPSTDLQIAKFIAYISAILTIFDFNPVLSIVGLSLACISIIICTIGVLTKKSKGSLKLFIILSIYNLIGHFIFLSYHLWMVKDI